MHDVYWLRSSVWPRREEQRASEDQRENRDSHRNTHTANIASQGAKNKENMHVNRKFINTNLRTSLPELKLSVCRINNGISTWEK